MSPAEGGRQLQATPAQIQGVYDDIDQKRRSTAYLHAPPLLLEPVTEIDAFRAV